jgi:hypothetical protein
MISPALAAAAVAQARRLLHGGARHLPQRRGRVPGVLRGLGRGARWSRRSPSFCSIAAQRARRRQSRSAWRRPLLYADRTRLVWRGYIPGSALRSRVRSATSPYFRSARERPLRAVHRLRISHNDLAKEQNWLRSPDGRAYLLDFQLASMFSRRSRLFRIAAYEDLRHFLKHKRRYVPDALTAMEKRVLARKSLPTRIWMATGKKVTCWSPAACSASSIPKAAAPAWPVTRRRSKPQRRRSPACARWPCSIFPTASAASASMPSSKPTPA